MSDRPAPNSIRSRQAAKRFRRRGRRLARRLLDEAYSDYLRGLMPLNNNNNNNSNNNSNDNYNHSNISVPSPPLPPSPQLPSPNQLPSPPRSPTPPFVESDSPHSTSTQRLFPDSPPPSVCSFSTPSYSPISSPEELPRPNSPANSTSSVEFIDEIHIPSPRHYYHYDPHKSLDTLILQFLQRTPLPSGYSIGPIDFDLSEIRTVILGQDPDTIIPVFLPPFLMKFLSASSMIFYNLFLPSTAIIREID